MDVIFVGVAWQRRSAAIELASAPMDLLRPLVSTLLISICVTACGDDGDAPTTSSTGGDDSTSDASTGEPGSSGESSGEAPTGGEEGGGSSSTGEPEPFLEGAPTPNSEPEGQEVDVLGSLGVHYWFAVDPAEVERMKLKVKERPTKANQLLLDVAEGGRNRLKSYADSWSRLALRFATVEWPLGRIGLFESRPGGHAPHYLDISGRNIS